MNHWDHISERDFQRMVIDLADLTGWVLQYHTYDSRRSNPGFPDLVLVRPPRILFIELKAQKGVITPAQKLWKEALDKCPGVESYIWRPTDGDEAQRTLQSKEKPPD